MFPSPRTLTDAELAADIATLRKIVSTGQINGIYMDWDTDDDMKGCLSDYEEEQTLRAERDAERVAEEQREAA